MKPRFTISRKIGFGFAVVLLTTLVLFILTYDTLRTGRSTNDRINEVYNPSISVLEQLKSVILRSRTSITAWALVQSREDTKEKMALVEMMQVEIPKLKYEIDSLALHWNDTEKRKKERAYKEIADLLSMYRQVQITLKDMQSYDDPFARFAMSEYAEEDGQIYRKANEVIDILNELIGDHRRRSTEDSVTMIAAFDRLEVYLRNLSIALFFFGIVIAYFTIRSIVRPISLLKDILEELGKGIFPKRAVVDTGDEVGEMSIALEQLVQGLRRTTEFSREVGQGNFEIHYNPLSDEDVLGKALLSMRDDLKKYEQKKRETERELEEKVQERTREVVKQKDKIEKQNQQRKELLENITASIRYAKRLQESFLPSAKVVRSLLPEHFIYYKPKDIVSGDFYFVKGVGDKVIVAAVDCTGHGVPGAFMSLVGHNSLNMAISENPELDPGAILRDLSRFAADSLNRAPEGEALSRDGMDLALCVYDPKAAKLTYAGAFNPLYLVRDGELQSFRPDKIIIGDPNNTQDFNTQIIKLKEHDMIYLFSDGYVDQFGGSEGRKYMYQPFRQLLTRISQLPVAEQQRNLAQEMDRWRMNSQSQEEQVDDMLVMGFRHV